jgi:hypothetical protein
VRGSIHAASRANTPSSAAHEVVVMTATITINGAHRSPAARAASSGVATPAPSASAMPASAPTAGAHGLRQASAITSAIASAEIETSMGDGGKPDRHAS